MSGHHSGGPDWCVTCGRIGCVEYADGPGYYEPDDCAHDWLDRPESDTHECLLCGIEGSGPIPSNRPGVTGSATERPGGA